MKNFEQILSATILGIAGFAFSQTAFASTITYQFNVPGIPAAPAALDPGAVDYIIGNGSGIDYGSLPQFNPSLGTRTNYAYYSATANYYFDDLITNISNTAQDVFLSPFFAVEFTDPLDSGLEIQAGSNNSYYILPHTTIEITGTEYASGGDILNVPQLTGTGMITYTVDATQDLGMSYLLGGEEVPDGVFVTSLSGAFNADLALTYQYTPAAPSAPEPVSALIMGLGLVTIGGLRRQRMRKRG